MLYSSVSVSETKVVSRTLIEVLTAANYLGEMAGLGVSIAKHYGNDIYTAFTPTNKPPVRMDSNSTAASDEDNYARDSFRHAHIHQIKLNEVA